MKKAPVFYIVSSAFDESNSPIDRSLHLLCHTLNILNYPAFLVITPLPTGYDSRWPYFARFPSQPLTNEDWNTPLLSQDVVGRHLSEGAAVISIFSATAANVLQAQSYLRVNRAEESLDILTLSLEAVGSSPFTQSIRLPLQSGFDYLTATSLGDLVKDLHASISELEQRVSLRRELNSLRLPYDCKMVFINYDQPPVAPPPPSFLKTLKRFVAAWLLPPAVAGLLKRCLTK